MSYVRRDSALHSANYAVVHLKKPLRTTLERPMPPERDKDKTADQGAKADQAEKRQSSAAFHVSDRFRGCNRLVPS